MDTFGKEWLSRYGDPNCDDDEGDGCDEFERRRNRADGIVLFLTVFCLLGVAVALICYLFK